MSRCVTEASKEESLRRLRLAWSLEGVALEKVGTVGWGPAGHPFTIGPRHVAFAADHRCGILTEEAIEASGVGCAARGCRSPLSEHKEEIGAFLRLSRDVKEEDLRRSLLAIKPLAEELGIAGFAFLGTEDYAVLRDGKPVMGRSNR